jgi:GNAT superfamily N-acetyltransferase
MIVRPSTVAEIETASTFSDLIAEYAAECHIAGMPPPQARMEQYRDLEAKGFLSVFAAVVEGELVGFISVLCAPLPHYSLSGAVSESFFVAKAHRGTLAGLKLLAAAEQKAAELGSPGLLVSAPFEGKLFELLPKLGYAETNRVFFKQVGPMMQRDIVVPSMTPRIPRMSIPGIDKVRRLESERAALPQVPLRTQHLLHGGMYARTVYVPAGTVITGTLIKVATVLIVDGDAMLYVDADEPLHCTGYNVMPASAGRKQAFWMKGNTALTMIFPTAAATVEQAEREFTDEFDLLASRRDGLNEIHVTGE